MVTTYTALGTTAGTANNFVTGAQNNARVTALGNDRFLVLWTTSDTTQDGSMTAIKGRIFTANGSPAGSEFLVNTATANEQREAVATKLTDGRFVVTWATLDASQDGAFGAIKAQIFNASGSKIGGEFLVNTITANDQARPTITALANGGFAIGWYSAMGVAGGTFGDVKAQIYDSSGAKSGTEFLVNTLTTDPQDWPQFATLANGNFMATWVTGLGASTDIKGQIFTPTGAKIGSEFAVATANAGQQFGPQVSRLANGGFIVVWLTADTTQDGSGYAVKAQIFSATGTKVGSEFLVNTTTAGNQGDASVTSLADGTILISWSVTYFTTGATAANSAIAAQIIDSSGNKLGTEFLVQSNNANLEYNPSVAALDSGGFAIAWNDIRNFGVSNNDDIAFRVYDSNTSPELGAAAIFVSALENQTMAAIPSATDFDGDSVTYSIVGGADSGKFGINASTGALSFVSAPNFESPTDSNSDNVYEVVVQASDGALTDTQAISILVTNANEAPVIISDGALATAAISLAENISAVTTIASTDPENTPRTYSITGGADAAAFSINSASGQLAFINAPNFENPADFDTNNIYDVIVSASDGELTDTQALAVTVANVNEAPIITSNGGGSIAFIPLPENTTIVTTVTSIDPEGSPRTYSIVGGADPAKFAINATTGVLSFVSPPDFEAPTNNYGNNSYSVIVLASDGVSSDAQSIQVEITNVNEAPVITSNGGGNSAVLSIVENAIAVTSVSATDPENSARIYSIAGGADAAKFTINANTGALNFVSGPNFEAPTDSGANNVYDVIVSASDGVLTDTQAIAVSVLNTNEGVAITSGTAFTAVENGTAAAIVSATDVDGDSVIYSVIGGADAALFTINATTGALSFVSAPNFEAPTDAGANNAYEVTISASDGVFTDTQAITVSVLNTNEGLSFTSATSFGVSENSTAVGIVSAADLDGDAVTYAISGGGDAARFAINATTGALSFVSAPNYEAPNDFGTNNVYDVIVSATDGSLTATSAITVSVGNVNEGVTITSGTSFSIAENGSAVATVTATDMDGDAITYSIAGGADAALFAINASTGALSFVSAPNYEAPADAGSNNIYDLIVSASDGSFDDTKAVAVTVTNTNEGLTFTSGTAFGVNENQLAIATVSATDIDGDAVIYAIAGGADAARFAINTSTGALSFVAAPNYEAPADAGANNVYDVIISASDGSLTATSAISVSVGNVNEGVTITTGAAFAVGENGTAVTSVMASDADGDAVSFAITGGADAALFAINTASGALSFIAAPNFEAPADADGNNVYDVAVTASDGSLTDTRTISVTVGNVNEAPVITSGGGGASASLSVAENGTSISTFTASDVDGDTITWSIAGGSDAALFVINPVTGVLSLINSSNFEAPIDFGGDNIYDVIVRASDGQLFDNQALAVTVTNVNEAPVITSHGGGANASVVIAENGSAVTLVSAADPENAAISYGIIGGADAARFTINPASGALSFVSSPNFEAPNDANGDNIYEVIVQASDGNTTDTQAIAVTVSNVNEAPIITTNGGGDAAAVSVSENDSAVVNVSATDPEGAARTYSIAGGADAARFTINASTGALIFVSAPNYELPADATADNVYDVIVQVSDGALTDSQSLSVIVTNVNEAPVITTNGAGAIAAVTIAENGSGVTTVASIDPENTAITYSIIGGADAGQLTINATTGALSFVAIPNFEAPTDAGGDNIYDVIVQASDGSLTDTQAIAVTVSNVNEAPIISSNGGGETASIQRSENQTVVTTVIAEDPDYPGANIYSYAIAGGADASKFVIDSFTGQLSFVSAPNFEAPTDTNGDNVYNVIVQASSGGMTDTQSLAVLVTNVNEVPVITSNGGASSAAFTIAENGQIVMTLQGYDPDGGPVQYFVLYGSDANRFQINASTGVLSFVTAPNFEAPTDTGANNIYDLTIGVVDGTGATIAQDVSVTVTNVNEAPVITSNGGGSSGTISVSENATGVTTIVAIDPEGTARTYSIIGGVDAAKFTINSASGVLSFASAPNYEAPSDVGANNVYDVIVQASDGVNAISQALAVNITNVNEAPLITSNGGGDTAAISIAENGTAVSTIASTDPEGTARSYNIIGGADAAKFNINATTGVLSFIAAPNYEAPTDAGANNIYDVIVQASDGGLTDSQAIAVTITNVNEAPVITSNGGGATGSITVNENTMAATIVMSTDPEGAARTFSITGGADAAKFAINTSTGALSFVAAPNYEAPTDMGANNVYDVIVQASDGVNVTSQALAIAVANVNEAPVITSNGGGDTAAISIAENGTAVTSLTSTDPEGTARAYSIVGGVDAAKFVINATTGALSFVTAPNYEAPTDNGANNVYDLIVQASDGGLTDTQAIAVTVTNVNEAPVITSNGGGAVGNITINENSTGVTTVTSTDPEGTTRTYSISGGADAAKFSINATSGALSFVAAPNYEAPTDVGANNVYDVIVRASDGTNATTQALAVTIANVVDGQTINGTAAANTLTGTNAEDTINGLGGNDSITGGAGADTLTGGTGADTFVYTLATDSLFGARDSITDFSRAQGDKISLTAIDANTNSAGDQNFSFIGTAAFSNVAGQLRYELIGGNTVVSGDVNGDGVADFAIQLIGSVSLLGTDFLL